MLDSWVLTMLLFCALNKYQRNIIKVLTRYVETF